MRTLAVVAVLLLVALMAFLGFSRHETIDIYLPELFRNNDKALHGTMFGLLAYALYFVNDKLRYLYNLAAVASLMILASVISEAVQSLFPYRTFDGYDILANLIGSTIGLVLAVISQLVWMLYKRKQRHTGIDREDSIPLNIMP